VVIRQLLEEFSEDVIRAFVQKNADYYLFKWRLMAKTGSKTSWNWAAAIFGGWLYQLWFFYRKMFLYGIVVYTVITGLTLLLGTGLGLGLAAAGASEELADLIVIPLSLLLILITILIFGFYGNYIYGKFVYDNLKKLSLVAKDEEELKFLAMNKGGTSVGYVFLGMLAEMGIAFVLAIPIFILIIALGSLSSF
jgi:hypothetical protein